MDYITCITPLKGPNRDMPHLMSVAKRTRVYLMLLFQKVTETISCTAKEKGHVEIRNICMWFHVLPIVILCVLHVSLFEIYLIWAYTVRFKSFLTRFLNWAKFQLRRVSFAIQCAGGSEGWLSTPEWPSYGRMNFRHQKFWSVDSDSRTVEAELRLDSPTSVPFSSLPFSTCGKQSVWMPWRHPTALGEKKER